MSILPRSYKKFPNFIWILYFLLLIIIHYSIIIYLFIDYVMKCLLMTCLDIKHSESLTYIINEPPTKWPVQL